MGARSWARASPLSGDLHDRLLRRPSKSATQSQGTLNIAGTQAGKPGQPDFSPQQHSPVVSRVSTDFTLASTEETIAATGGRDDRRINDA
jgi:hypothetical protein